VESDSLNHYNAFEQSSLDFFVWVKGLQPSFSFICIMSFVDLENNEYIVFNAWTSSAPQLKYSHSLLHTSHTQQEKIGNQAGS
jgi:hypothetical protein